jgi:hypothetical protein
MSLFGIFGKDPRKIFLEMNPAEGHWRVVTWNLDLSSSLQRQWTVEVHGKNLQVIHWTRQKGSEFRFYKNNKLISHKKITEPRDELSSLMNLAIHSTLKYGIEKNHDFMRTPVSGATAMDLQNETRALQWIQVSFGTLVRALDKVKSSPDLILTGAFFSGTIPETKEEVLRFMAFNLDIFYYLRPDSSVQIVVFDDKNLGHGMSKTPSFQQIIKVTKPQFYDEIIKLLHCFAQVGEIN